MAYPGVDGARSRYVSSFQSSIFEPLKPQQGQSFIPAGKRRDQTTSEMFGTYNDKELHAMPKTFVPKDDGLTARQRKLEFLSSDALPSVQYAANDAPALPREPKVQELIMEAGTEETIDPSMRRQQELQSALFERKTPEISAQEVHDIKKRLTPNDFKWFNMPEKVHEDGDGQSHHDRSYMQKCSNIFDHKSPGAQDKAFFESEKREREEDAKGDLKRRANAYYSDLFGRTTPMDVPDGSITMHPKLRGPDEDQIAVHQDWTDSKTELIKGAHADIQSSPANRKTNEFNTSRVFGSSSGYDPLPAAEPVTTDNSAKVKRAFGMNTQQIHQAHLQTSMTSQDFYNEAFNTKAWEVMELHISGLTSDVQDSDIKKLCMGFDLQIVKVSVDMDPVRNLCKGRAKITVRYNPERDSIGGLVRKLESVNLIVEL